MPAPAADERPRFCPFCGAPVGSFFGHHESGGATWCERCQEWFAAARSEEPPADRPPDGECRAAT